MNSNHDLKFFIDPGMIGVLFSRITKGASNEVYPLTVSEIYEIQKAAIDACEEKICSILENRK